MRRVPCFRGSLHTNSARAASPRKHAAPFDGEPAFGCRHRVSDVWRVPRKHGSQPNLLHATYSGRELSCNNEVHVSRLRAFWEISGACHGMEFIGFHTDTLSLSLTLAVPFLGR